jgi:predicted peptidase
MASFSPQAHSFSSWAVKHVDLRYLLWLPANASQPAPLILFLHGSGERGDDLGLVMREGLPASDALHSPDFPFVVAAPQCSLESDWELEGDALLALLDDLEARLPIDRQRIYLTGLSMGGRGAWHLAARAASRFAALVPICGRRPAWLCQPDRAARLRDLPTWIFHGARDPVVPISESEAMADTLRSCGADVRLTIDPEAGHDSWTAAYATPELYTWLLSHQRDHER